MLVKIHSMTPGGMLACTGTAKTLKERYSSHNCVGSGLVGMVGMMDLLEPLCDWTWAYVGDVVDVVVDDDGVVELGVVHNVLVVDVVVSSASKNQPSR